MRYPNSEEIQTDDSQYEEIIFPLQKRSYRKCPSLFLAINSVFILVASMAIIGPPILGKVFSIHIGVSQYNHFDAGLHRGDLLVIKDVEISQITSGDVVIVHGIMGETPDQQHLGSAIAVANSKKLDVLILGDSGHVSATETVSRNSKIQVVVRYFPKVGNIVNFLFCNLVKVGFVFFVGIYNLVIYILRRRDANSNEYSEARLFDSVSESVAYVVPT